MVAMYSFTVLLSTLLTVFLSKCYSMTAPTVMTTYGPVSGSVSKLSTNKTAKIYLGIPFAKAKRFENPVPPDKWTSTLHLNATRSVCPQPLIPLTQHRRPLFNEDCLQLSVYIPENANSSSRLAVMLWIHGGGFVGGDTILYDGCVLATEGNVIVVVAAYRLGVLGFLSSNSGDLRGNYGMMDQIEAMRWVNKNIESFGGDSRKVTIFGVSAGGASVGLLMLSPLTKGLYQNAILQSGTPAAFFSYLERHEADSVARSFAQLVGCDFFSLKECARAKTVEEILNAQLKMIPKENVVLIGPVVDGYFLPDSPPKLLQAEKFNASNVIVGVTRDDGGVFVVEIPGVQKGLNMSYGISRARFKEEIRKRLWIRHQTPRITDLLVYEYTDWSNVSNPYVLREQFLNLFTDSFFKAPAVESAEFFVKKQVPTYLYQLEIAPKSCLFGPLPEWSGIYHGADVVYTFGLPLVTQKNQTSDTEVRFAKKFITLWSNFAKTGNPNSPTPLETTWPQYTSKRGEYIGLGPKLTARSKMRPEKMALWNELLPSQLVVEPTTESPMPTTIEATPADDKDKLVMTLAILTGIVGALSLIFLVFLIVMFRKLRRHRKKDCELY